MSYSFTWDSTDCYIYTSSTNSNNYFQLLGWDYQYPKIRLRETSEPEPETSEVPEALPEPRAPEVIEKIKQLASSGAYADLTECRRLLNAIQILCGGELGEKPKLW